MGLLGLFSRKGRGSMGEPATASVVNLPARPTRLATEIATELLDEFGEDVPVDVLLERADGAGLQAQAIDDAMDAILRDRAVTKVFVNTSSLQVVDLRGLETVRQKIKGTGYYVTYEERRGVGDVTYLLIREPDNVHDANAISVIGHGGRKVGHVSASRAGIMAPLLDRVGANAYRVTGANGTETSSMLWVDLPTAAALRTFVRDH